MTDNQLNRFLAKIEIVEAEYITACWQWTAGLNRYGYGNFELIGGAKKAAMHRNIMAHRISHEHWIGPIPPRYEVDHLCRNTRCVNPDHLEAVTSQVNNLRSTSPAALNAQHTHCPSGHPFSSENTRYQGSTRKCRTCEKKHHFKDNERKKALRLKARLERASKPLQRVTHCKYGHEYTPENTLPATNGSKNCRTCNRERSRRYHQEHRENRS